MLYHHWSDGKYCVEVSKATNHAYSMALHRSVSQHFLNIIKSGFLHKLAQMEPSAGLVNRKAG
jgi:hypothetical protein